MSARADGLERFLQAQGPALGAVRAELQEGKKRTHWMWFVFPQLRGLGSSSTSQFYGLASGAEARGYWEHPVLGPRLKACVAQVMATPRGRSAHDIFDSPDDLKFWSCMTLFNGVVPEEPLFAAALDRFYGGLADTRTMDLLASEGGRASVPPLG